MKLRCLLLFVISVGAVLSAGAQLAVGSWKTFAAFSTVDRVVDTPGVVYYLTCGQLYSYDKENEETYNYSTGRRLSDSNIKTVYYNYEKDYLVVVYSNSNIDIIDSEGCVYNLPDIKDASIGVIPVVNDMDFDGDRIYVGTNFGVVVFDYRKKEVVTSGNYGLDITSVTVCDDTLWLIAAYRFYSVDKNRSLTSVDALTLWPQGYTVNSAMTLSGDMVVMLTDQNSRITVARLKESEANIEVTCERAGLGIGAVKNLHRLADGSIMCHTYNAIYIVTPDGDITSTSVSGTDLEAVKVGAGYEIKNIASYRGMRELWLGSDAGLSSFSVDGGEITVLSEPSRPDNALTFSLVGRMEKGESGALYAFSYGFSNLLGENVNPGNTEHGLFYINRIKDGVVSDITPVEYSVKNRNHRPYGTSPVGYKGGYLVKEDPNNPDCYVVGSMWDGFYYMKDGKEIVHYYEDNSSMMSILNGYRLEILGLEFDRKGNLWAVTFSDKNQFNMLEASKVGRETAIEDWQVADYYVDNYHTGYLLSCRHSDNMFYIDGGYESHPAVIKTNGTASPGDDTLIVSSELVDQDGLYFSFARSMCLLEDKRGRVWLGTDNGIVEITDPDDITGSKIRVNHLKVPRRDGTNFADYLLNGETICAMAVDASNRKWIATFNSGVYLVSENGDEILEHFDPTNSPIPDYAVYSVVCDNSNNVYFGTANGIVMYSSMSAPARDDFSEVYAYPNPVRPEYTGWITITGLMENSLVKIADAAGNVFHQATSEGGMLVWDGCDRQGHRVKTGVYYVFASQSGEGMETHGAVTKILVVN